MNKTISESPSYSKKASIIIVTYNHKDYIVPCINSIEEQDYPHEIIVVDSHSKDGTPDFVREHFPEIEVIDCRNNLGYGTCNNLGILKANGPYIVVLNPDTIAKADWLRELIGPLDACRGVITTPKILTYDGSYINTCGNINHFTGLTFTRGLGKSPDEYAKQEYVSGFSGCCFAMRKEDFLELGGFDERFFLYNEDSDLSWRANLKGFKVLFVPTSKVLHDYRLRVSPEKLYYLEKGRYIILRKYIPSHALVSFIPSLIMAEILTFGYSARWGFNGLKHKIRAIADGVMVDIGQEEGNRQNLYRSLDYAIPEDQLSFNSVDKLIKIIANRVFAINLKVIR